MKGVVFTEFLELVEDKFSIEMAEGLMTGVFEYFGEAIAMERQQIEDGQATLFMLTKNQ